MNVITVIQNAKILNIVDRETKAADGNTIKWTEVVFMKDSDINTVTVDREVAMNMAIESSYDLLLQISENMKVSGNRAFKAHKFKVIDCFDID